MAKTMLNCEKSFDELFEEAKGADHLYDEFRDDMMTESYERNCKFYGNETVDSYLKLMKKRKEKNG